VTLFQSGQVDQIEFLSPILHTANHQWTGLKSSSIWSGSSGEPVDNQNLSTDSGGLGLRIRGTAINPDILTQKGQKLTQRSLLLSGNRISGLMGKGMGAGKFSAVRA